MASWNPSEIAKDFVWQTSLPADTVEQRREIVRIIQDDMIVGRTMVGETFPIKDYICHPCTLTLEETGELAEGVRTLLITPDCKSIGFVSRTIIESLQRVLKAEGRLPPWDPPIWVRLKMTTSKGVRVVYKLIPVAPPV